MIKNPGRPKIKKTLAKNPLIFFSNKNFFGQMIKLF